MSLKGTWSSSSSSSIRDSGILGCVASTHCEGEYPLILDIMFFAAAALSTTALRGTSSGKPSAFIFSIIDLK